MNNILVISPHPDDESIGCGGTLMKHVKEGDQIEIAFLTSGENGSKNILPEKLARIREKEAQQVAKSSGFQKIEFWREPDGKLKAHSKLVARMQEKLLENKPDLIYVPHAHEMYPDHCAAARIVKRAFKKLPHSLKKPQILMFEVWTPIQKIDHIVDISDYIKYKMAAIRMYKSQCRLVKFNQAFLGLNRYRGEMHSWPGGDYAEVFTYG